MALPTIHHQYIPAASGSSGLVNFMTALQAKLLAAGWTIEYADSDAIGSGDASNPAWNKTPATNTDAGVVVYRMPLNGHTTQWYVRLRPGWASTTDWVQMRGVTIGDTHDGSGAVTGAGSELTTAYSSAATNLEVAISASEDGFCLIIRAQNAPNVLVERLRAWDGTVTDDVIVTLANATATHLHARAGVGVVTQNAPIVLAALTGTTASYGAFSAGSSLANGDGDEIPIVGPFWPGGDPFYGPPRVAFLGPANDYTALGHYERVVDGGSKTYLAMNNVQASNWARWLVATE